MGRWRSGSRRRPAATASAEAPARHVVAITIPTEVTTAQGNPGWRYVGRDQRNRQLEIIAVEVSPGNGATYLLVVHVMPITLRR